MKISFFTLGCKLNQAETDELKKTLCKQKFLIVPFGTNEDIAVVRACGVTCGASQTTREMVRRAKRVGSKVVVIGCLENIDLPEIDFIAKNNEEVIRYILEELKNKKIDKNIAPSLKITNKNDGNDRTRALIKIQTGCNFNCAYCIIPTFRGRTQSVSAEEVIKKIKQAELDGYKEITLTGVNICQYRYQKMDLTDLLKLILEKTKIPRIRLGSLDPRLISNKFIELYTGQFSNLKVYQFNNRLLPHWHLSLQSGSNTVLKRMNRNYTAKKYFAIVKKLRTNYPLFSFTTDIIVGFPEETEKEFLETCDFVKKVGFSKVHIFPFSPRPSTMAANMKQIDVKIKKERCKRLKIITGNATTDYTKQFVGLTRPVLFEKKNGREHYEGYTPEYLKIKIKTDTNLVNKIKKIKLTERNLKNRD